MHTANFWKKEKDGVACRLCPHSCRIKDGFFGKCNARANINGSLVSLVYGKPVSVNIDPIEKKPLYHFLPGSLSLSIGTTGCNLFCMHCQNWQMSRAKQEIQKSAKQDEADESGEITPETIVSLAIEKGCKSISYTYNEPTIFHEYAVDCAKLARKKGLKNVIVTNGYIQTEAAEEFAKYMDAANVDLKSFNNKFYKDICGGSLKPVLNTLKVYHGKIWLEITNLILDRKNDNMKETEEMCKWIKTELSSDVPLHFSRAFPMNEMLDIRPTPKNTLSNAKSIADKYLNYVYIGNTEVPNGSDTICPECKKAVIKRQGYNTEILMNNGRCSCGKQILGIF
jgi:pyruvate formate lyase activating enzyme